MTDEMRDKVARGEGFIAALDQSGGSTPKALAAYGVPETAYEGEAEMFAEVHRMRTRIMTSAAFDGERILGAILFERTMDDEVEGVPTATYLWETKGVVPFLKVDKGLADEADGVQLMKPIPDLADQLRRATGHGIFGTKMRSVIKRADETGIAAIAEQQFEVGSEILAAGLVPILEPEIDIHSPDKAASEALLRDRIAAHLEALPDGQQVMLKLSLPDEDGFYTPLIEHPKVLRVVALSGGYSRDEANERLARNPKLIASFSRALLGELSVDMTDDEFDRALDTAVRSIHAASIT